MPPTPEPPRSAFARASRVVVWNLLLLVGGLGLVAATGETVLRLQWPFASQSAPLHFMPGVGLHFRPHAEVRRTNRSQYWTISRTNSFGFVDREPPLPNVAAASCHVVFVGDSYVEAGEVSIAHKIQVRLEEMAADRLPGWDVTTAGYGLRGTGQVHQLIYWDKWIRQHPPDLVVLVFVPNDFAENRRTSGPHMLMVTANRSRDGSWRLLRPDPSWASPSPFPYKEVAWNRIPETLRPRVLFWIRDRSHPYASVRIPREEDFEQTSFAFDQWKERTQWGGAQLVVLSTHEMRWLPEALTADLFGRMMRLADGAGIPVIDQYDYIVSQGYDPKDAQWNDGHWSATGHRWGAEAVLEHMTAVPPRGCAP